MGNATSNVSIPATNATSELLSNNTVAVLKNVTQPVLDVKPEKTTAVPVTQKKEETIDDEEDEDDEDNAKEIPAKPQVPESSEKEHYRREQILVHRRFTSFSWTNS